jgi:2-isopropylmalate synthase
LKHIASTGVREFIVGCGPELPEVWEGLFFMRESGEIPSDTEATFIVLLNCWESAYNNFSSGFDKGWIEETVFSFGMINYRESEQTFQKAIQSFRNIGAKRFKASVLNNFRGQFTNEKYSEICRQIDIAINLGVDVIRINDSVGELQPHVTHELCGKLVNDYPDIIFCLHAHNDSGLAVSNAMASIQAGFQMIEGSLAGFGNRSGIAPLEQIVGLCQKNNISLGGHQIDLQELSAAARYSEQVFLQIPNVFRPVSGLMEMDSNFGVLNIPDYLEIQSDKEYFVNYPGLHPVTIKMALDRHCAGLRLTNEQTDSVIKSVKEIMKNELSGVKSNYETVIRNILEFYSMNSWTTQRLADEITSFVEETSLESV